MLERFKLFFSCYKRSFEDLDKPFSLYVEDMNVVNDLIGCLSPVKTCVTLFSKRNFYFMTSHEAIDFLKNHLNQKNQP